jgi:alpha-N-acetylglucosaminidase
MNLKTMLFLCLPLAGGFGTSFPRLEAATPPEESAAALARRVLGPAGTGFRFEQIQADQGRDVFELDQQKDSVVVRGNTGLSMAFGLNWYLKYYAQASVSLNCSQIRIPRPLPTVEKKVRMTGWAQSRYFLNYCTFSYSMSWWDWAQWEKFIDWMALNGINQPLAVTGQEGVWQAVGRRFDMTDTEIDAFLAGPPYLPFSWMGCLDGHGGPLPKNWIPQHVELEKKILARERELGMTPVLQGFTGHVPEAILKKFPGTKAHRIHWIEFDTSMLDPLDPLFQKLGTAFIEEQTKLFGTDHLYAADSFIEMTPPSGDLNYLAGVGRAIYAGMAQADPQAVWLLQGWTFMNQAQFWKQDRIKAFLDAVPSEHMLVLDLFCESNPVWNTTQGFYGKPWVWSFVHLFGDRTSLGTTGSLDRFNDLADARKDPLGRNVRGVGLMMEGYGHNPIIFDAMFELGWRDDIDLKPWVRDFSRYRYGIANADAQAAWETLRTTLYNHSIDGQTIVSSFPPGGPRAHYPAPALMNAFRLLLQAQNDLGKTDTYRHDLVNVARQTLSNHAGRLHAKAIAAYQNKDAAAYRKASAEFLELITDLDELLATSDQFLLGSWLEDAKRWGANDSESAKLEWNARRILTLWGTGAALRDYAWKEWSGLLTGFYRKRWEIFFRRQQESLEAGKPFDQVSCDAELYRFENEWCQQTELYPSKSKGDSVKVAQRLFDKYMVGTQTLLNLTTGKPATCSFALPGMEAALANDGEVDTESYWGTDVSKDSAAWWRVDLEKPVKVGRVVVVGYYGDNRYYGFTVEGSIDGKKWDMLADRHDNTEPSTQAGYSCPFKPVEVRYLRVTMTHNSANTGRHLVEVMAFEN